MNALLINEPPLQVLPSLAIAVGLNEAIVVQQLHYWLKKSKNVKDGRPWVYNNYEDWQQQFPFWSLETVKRVFRSLEKKDIVISSQKYNSIRIDRTKWYSINYKKLNEIAIVQKCTTMGSNRPHVIRSNRPHQ